MPCPKCGGENPDNIQTCQHCSVPIPAAISEGQPKSKTSWLAIAALAFVFLMPLTYGFSIFPAFILGIIAVVKIRRSQGRLKGLGFAIASIVISGLIIFDTLIVGIHIASSKIAKRMQCEEKLCNLRYPLNDYANDNNGNFPIPSQWCDLLKKDYNVTDDQFVCPSNKNSRCSYAINPNASDVNCPGDMVLLFETKDGWNQSGGREILTFENHRGDGANILFVDGHVEFVRPADANNLRWTKDK